MTLAGYFFHLETPGLPACYPLSSTLWEVTLLGLPALIATVSNRILPVQRHKGVSFGFINTDQLQGSL